MAIPSRIDGQKAGRLEKAASSHLIGFMRNHACIGARSLAERSLLRGPEPGTGAETATDVEQALFFALYPDMHTVETALAFVTDIEDYFFHSDPLDEVMKSFVAIFWGHVATSQNEFAKDYWDFAQTVSDISLLSHKWPPNIGRRVSDTDFELCLVGRPIFTTTLNNGSPRIMRRFTSSWVMNQTSQFDALRRRNHFVSWQSSIRKMDSELDPSGEPNPVLADHGTSSAAPQLAGSSLSNLNFTVPEDYADIVSRGEKLLHRAHLEGCNSGTIIELEARIDRCRSMNTP
ncbi:MAG: YqcI/YcgG family protein [Caulobacter sp.]